MTVFLGSAGYVELQRTAAEHVFHSAISPSDVNAAKNRFSFDFPSGMLLTGDRIEIRATDGGLLTFVSPTGWAFGGQQDRGTWYVNVDELGGIRLYPTFHQALNGEVDGLVDLQVPDRTIPVDVESANSEAKCLGKVTSYEFNNSREAVDVTALSDEFRRQHSSLISGSGSITCQFDYRIRPCEGGVTELASYMHQLILRQQLGAEFAAKLFVVGQGFGVGDASDDRLWFSFSGIITNAGIAVSPTSVIRSTFEFVTTGEIALKAATIGSNYLLQESRDFILLEQDALAKLEIEYD